MSSAIRKDKEAITEQYQRIMDVNSNPKNLSLLLEADEAHISLVNGPWIWDVVLKYFPLAAKTNWKEYAIIVKAAVKICQERGVQIGIVPMEGKLTKKEKEWVKNGFWWRINRFQRIGRLTKRDAIRLQEHRYCILGGVAKGGIKVLMASGYEKIEAKKLFMKGSLQKLSSMELLPEKKDFRKLLEVQK